MAGTNFPFRTGTGIGRNWVKKGAGIGNSPEFHGIPLGIHNQASSSNAINDEYDVVTIPGGLGPCPRCVKPLVLLQLHTVVAAPCAIVTKLLYVDDFCDSVKSHNMSYEKMTSHKKIGN